MHLIHKLTALLRVLPSGRGAGSRRLLGLLVRRPQIMAAVAAYETALVACNRVDGRIKALASLKTGALIGCPF